jgi:hypothetical protein
MTGTRKTVTVAITFRKYNKNPMRVAPRHSGQVGKETPYVSSDGIRHVVNCWPG